MFEGSGLNLTNNFSKLDNVKDETSLLKLFPSFNFVIVVVFTKKLNSYVLVSFTFEYELTFTLSILSIKVLSLYVTNIFVS